MRTDFFTNLLRSLANKRPSGCTPKPAPDTHMGANPRYNGQGRRYHERSRYLPHIGLKEIKRHGGEE